MKFLKTYLPLTLLLMLTTASASFFIPDLSITTAKLATTVINGFSAVTPVGADYVAIAQTSASNVNKKALVSGLRNAVYRSVTTTDTVGADDETMKLSGASFTSTLPTAIGIAGKRYKFIHAGAANFTNAYTLATNPNTQTIGGIASGSFVLRTIGEVLEIESDGANWMIVSHKTETAWVNAGVITITPSTTLGNFAKGTTALDQSWWRRVGSMMEVRYVYQQSGAGVDSTAAGLLLLTVPAAQTIDVTMNPANTSITESSVATAVASSFLESSGWIVDNSTSRGPVSMKVFDTTHLAIYSAGTSFAFLSVASAAWTITDSGLAFSAMAKIPISGWQP